MAYGRGLQQIAPRSRAECGKPIPRTSWWERTRSSPPRAIRGRRSMDSTSFFPAVDDIEARPSVLSSIS